MKKRILSLAMALALAVGLMAIPAQAAGVEGLTMLSSNTTSAPAGDFRTTPGVEAFQPVINVQVDTVLTGLSVYHFNGGAGATPGVISLFDNATRARIGSWDATGRDGNTWWDAFPNIQLEAGKSYFVDCSDRLTWSIDGSGEKNYFIYESYGYAGTLPAEPAPVVETPAPVVETPAPVVETPAPVVETPAPVVETPAPAPVSADQLSGFTLLYSNEATCSDKDFKSAPGTEAFQPMFSVSGTNVVLQTISLNHFNGGAGAAPGFISLYDSATRQLIGSWQAVGRDGNTWWDAYPNIELETGRTYCIDCSGRQTWRFGGDKNFFNFMAYGYHVPSGVAPVDLACYTFPSANVVVDGVTVQRPEHLPYINVDSRTMTVLVPIASALGLTSSWDGVAGVASYTDGNRTLYFPVGSNCAYADNGEVIHMDTQADIRDGAAFTPIRCLAEYFGYDVSWYGGTMTVYINSPA